MHNRLGSLYIVATPIGNLADMTFRAVEILKEVDLILCEDTRTTGILLKKYEIKDKKLDSYNAVNGKSKNEYILKLLNEGKNVALVSDAGTPGISDPGYSLTHYIREHTSPSLSLSRRGTEQSNIEEVEIIPIGGISALTTFISACGHGTNKWTFYGFLPHKNGRQTILKEMLSSENSSVFYESTHRIEKCLEQILEIEKSIPHLTSPKIGEEQNRKIVIGRELTKIYEEYLFGTAVEILEIFKKYPEKKRGEFVVMIV
jgi:16S rRNA (cytidine1402-2'-O)-methyltransferase